MMHPPPMIEDVLVGRKVTVLVNVPEELTVGGCGLQVTSNIANSNDMMNILLLFR
jgi:hypothetical protein